MSEWLLVFGLSGFWFVLYIGAVIVSWVTSNLESHTSEWRDQRLIEWIQRELPVPPPLSEEDPSHPAFAGWSPSWNCRLNGHVFTDSNYCEVCKVLAKTGGMNYYSTEY